MSDTAIPSILFAVVGLLFIGLGIPLFRSKVRPNFWYGCRTTRTLTDEELWYAVNRVTGRDLIAAGIALVMSSLVVFMLTGRMDSTLATLILLTVAIIAIVIMVVNSLRAQKQSGHNGGE